ncbi:hypothetical protein, partial [Paracoccus liaowanqingii]|uniref:hypothetical protein n=1 Tax=Paracoccus liaowanqingii TaxID=2560053 RepID=UPI00143DE64B
LHPLITTALICAIYLQRFGLQTPSGAFISAGHIIVLIACLVLLVLRRAVVDIWLLVLLTGFLVYSLLLSITVVTSTQIGIEVAPQSLFLLATLYAVLCIVPTPLSHTRDVLFVYNRHMLVLGIVGVMQFALQFVGVKFFSFRGFVPEVFLIEHAYNVVIPLSYGSEFFKSNGVFFLEPSLFSQFLAIALAAEIMLFRRTLYMAVYGMAIVASYSGSGLLTLTTAFVILS